MTYGANAYGGCKAYQEIGVKTASQGKLVVMLYEAAVSNLEKALALVDDNNKVKAENTEEYGNHLQKVSDIITELEISLDMERGGEIAKNLMSLYIWFNQKLLECSLRHDKKLLSDIYKMLSDLRDSWVIAANSNANAQTNIPQDRPFVNISG